MKRLAIPTFLAIFLLSGLLGAGLTQADSPAPPLLAYITAPDAGASLLSATGLTVYARAGSGWLAGVEATALDRLAAAGFTVEALGPLSAAGGLEGLYLAYAMPGRDMVDWDRHATTLLTEQGWRLIRATPAGATALANAGVELDRVTSDPKPLLPQSRTAIAPTEVGYDPVVQAIMDQVLSQRVYKVTGDLSGEWPVAIGSGLYTIGTRNTYSGLPIQKATQLVAQRLEALGLDVETHQWSGSTFPNVIGEITGLINPEDIYILSAHLDDMPSYGLAPGADDNASGSAATLIAAEILSQYQWGCTLRFGLWTGEEQGLLGSHAYAQRAFNQGENIVGVLNLDMIAWNAPLSSRTIDLHAKATLPGTMELAQLFADVIDVYGLNLIPEIVPNGSGASDHASFWQYGYPAILGIEDFADFNPYYHTSNDLLANLDLNYFTEFIKASIGSFVHLSDCLIPCEPVEIVDVATSVEGCVVDFEPEVAGTAPISWDWSFEQGNPSTSSLANPLGINFGLSGTYAYTVTAANCSGAGQDTFVNTVTVACETCTPLAGIELDQVTPNPIRPGDTISFSAGIEPGGVTTPYSYTVTVDGAPILTGQSDADPLLFDHALSEAGEYEVAISAWNCNMAEPVTDTLTVTVEAEACIPPTEVSLMQASPGAVLVGVPVTVTAEIGLAGASLPYSYTLTVDGVEAAGGTSSAGAMDFQITFDAAGTHEVVFAAWNCDMAEPLTESQSITVEPVMFYIFQPVMWRP